MALGIAAVLLGIVFEKQNIAFMVSLAFAVAASANFPVLFLSVLWKDCTTKGAVIGGFLGPDLLRGAHGALAVGVGSHAGQPPRVGAVPLPRRRCSPMTIGFVGVWLFSVMDKAPTPPKNARPSRRRKVRSETGLGASKASAH